jgi:hypothetical protein
MLRARCGEERLARASKVFRGKELARRFLAGAALLIWDEVSAMAVWVGGEGKGKWVWIEGVRGVK